MMLALSIGVGSGAIAPHLASAGLGDWDSSIDTDSDAIVGKINSVRSTGKFTVYEIKSPSRTIHEYATPEGRIFAVTWRGINAPNLQRLLGSYADEYAAEMDNGRELRREKAKPRQAFRQSRTRNKAIVVRMGHMRDMRGKMFVESLFPPGVTPHDLR